MKFKLDENLGLLGKSLLETDGHGVMTITQGAAVAGHWGREVGTFRPHLFCLLRIDLSEC